MPRSSILKVPRRHSHFVFGVIQSGLTCSVAAAIASYPFVSEGTFFGHWMTSLAIAWLTMLPIVLLAAPLIRKIVEWLTTDELA